MQIRFNALRRPMAVATLLVVGGTSAAWAQQVANATANATATIITPIAISKTSDLLFGKLAVGATGGTVAVSAADVVTIGGASNTISQPPSSTGNPAAAVFAVTGEANLTYSVTLPTNGTITLSDGTHTMAVDNFVSNPSGTGTLSAGGSQTLKVGATLTVGNNQAPGAYTGTFSVTVAYN